MSKQPVRVHIFNQTYSLLADGDPVVASFERHIREHLSEPVRIEDAGHQGAAVT